MKESAGRCRMKWKEGRRKVRLTKEEKMKKK